jgi:hypothetical protein
MNRLQEAVRRIVGDLRSLGHSLALVGGLAVSARTEPRFTRDVDFAVSVADDAESEILVRDLVARGYRVLALVEQDSKSRLATIRLVLPGSGEQGVVADLLFASSGVEAEVVASAQPLELFPGQSVPVARIGHLLALKLLSRDPVNRPQDEQDLRALARAASPEDVALAGEAVTLIEARGFARGKDLCAALAAAMGRS